MAHALPPLSLTLSLPPPPTPRSPLLHSLITSTSFSLTPARLSRPPPRQWLRDALANGECTRAYGSSLIIGRFHRLGPLLMLIGRKCEFARQPPVRVGGKKGSGAVGRKGSRGPQPCMRPMQTSLVIVVWPCEICPA
jgi:hypothetical protein